MEIKLTRNLQIGFGLSLLFLLIISLASYISIENLFKSAGLVDHSNLVVQKLEYSISIMKDAETGQRGYLLTDDKSFLGPYNGSYQRAINEANEFQRLTVDNPRQQTNAAAIKEILFNRLNFLEKLIQKKEAGLPVTNKDLASGKSSMDALRKAINVAEKDEKVLLNIRLARLRRFSAITPLFLIITALGAIVITVFAYSRVMNGINERARLYEALEVKEQETAAVNEELAAANEELGAVNEELATANEELNASNEELASANEELNAANDDLAAFNEELNAANEQLVEAQANVGDLNEKLGASNEELSATVEELYNSQQNLQALNNDLEDRVERRTRALSESEGRFRVMMEAMPQIAWTSRTDGAVSFLNKQWYDYTGLKDGNGNGWEWKEIIHPDDLDYMTEKYKSILASGEEGEFETREKRADGEYRWHLVRTQPVRNGDGEIHLWVGTATDIHDLKNLQQQKDDFISIASHELKTPVTSLKVSLQLLNRIKDNAVAPIFTKLIGQANKSLDKVGTLIEDLLNVSKLNQGQLHLNKTTFTIGQLVEDCCQHIRIEGLYTLATTGDTRLEVYADADRIEQVITNFVNNALKYAPESKEILIGIKKEGDMARVSVTDKGPGIQPEKVGHLFERYYRVDSIGMQFSGLGLGLYISAEIIKRHGGQIGVDTEVGKGSSFWFTIPLKG